MPEREPLLYVGPLSHRVYLTLRYKELPSGTIEVTGKKYDVTDQVGRVLEQLDQMGLKLFQHPAARSRSQARSTT